LKVIAKAGKQGEKTEAKLKLNNLQSGVYFGRGRGRYTRVYVVFYTNLWCFFESVYLPYLL